ncbi:MAG: type I DNA topoisomerase [Candidatus Pacebacteria bacterium]|nr:type I DNA topoisomerase [Candidatus Paceibacterota bacterium]
MKLLIVESPSKAKTIEKYLGGAFTVRASVGHVRDLPKSNKKAIDIEAGFVPHYENSPQKEKVIRELRALAKKADAITLATDPDREGEAISWHIKQILDEDKKVKASIQRVTFHEITKEAVEEALKHPRDIDENLVSAQEARRVLDRLVGYDLSGLIWKKVRYGLSAGRVQSPALRIIMEREREIRAFIPETYWVLEAETTTPKKSSLSLVCSEEPRDKKIVDTILAKGQTGTWIVDDVKESEQKRSPRAPFTTSTLQQTASTRLGFSPSRTMQVAQKLYEAGHITYMRTDSTTLSKVATDAICAYISKKYGADTIETRIYKTKSKNAQEAHEAIRPTHIEHESKGMNDEQHALYRLIWERTVSSQMVDAKVMRTKIVVAIQDENIPFFQANGSRLLYPGWLEVDRGARGEDVELPALKTGDIVTLVDLRSIEKATEPPHRYSEAGLVKELESRGIGRPSTYASIMRTLEERGYVSKEGKTLFPTDTGDVVSTFLENNFGNYIGDTFTAEMEDKLDDIASGKRDYTKTLSDFYTPFLKEVQLKDKLEKITTLGDAPKEFPCPVCQKDMIVKLGKNGKFLSCSDFPICMGGRTYDGKIMEPPKEIGEICPLCGFDKKGNAKKTSRSGGGKLVLREGRFGMFISCSRYPKCKFIKEDEEERKKKLTGVACPACKDGEMMERRGRFGIFYSCTNYPTCKNAIKAKPTGRICPLCDALMMEGTKTIPERCSNTKCPNHRPDKLQKK